MGLSEFAIAVGLGVLGCGGVYRFMRDESKAIAMFDKRNDIKVFYESLKKAPIKNKLSYALFSSRYVKKYIRGHPTPENLAEEVNSNSEGDSLMEALKRAEDKRAIGLMYPEEHESRHWTEEDFKKAEKILKKQGVSQEAIDDLNKPW
jgi:hypothetical protein